MMRPILTLSLCAFAGVASAQQTIPADLASALAASGGFTGDGEPAILVGAMPLSLKLALPAGSSLLGSATYGRNITTVVAFRGPSDSAISTLTASALQAGWKATQRPANFGFGGFMPSPRSTGIAAATPPTTLCGDSVSMNFRVARRRNDSSWIAIRIAPSAPPPAFSECTMRIPRYESRQATLPVLYNPPAAGADMTSCIRALYPDQEDQQRGVANSTGGMLRVAMSPEAIADHYAKQLQDSGWAPRGVSPVLHPPAMRTWTRTDSLGLRLLTLTITPAARDSTCYQTTLDVRPAPRTP